MGSRCPNHRNNIRQTNCRFVYDLTKYKGEDSMDEEKKKVGRTKIEIDEDLLLKLATIHCTMKEMVDILGVSEDTLKRNFAGIIDKGKASGKMRLRRKQMEVALEGNPTMLIFLGKAMLGQSDNPLNSDDKKILPWSDDT